ncbi:MAG: hypothetical protein LBC70_02510 [Chitinispirillales bacterium]|jgi:hypothetical protein|nr:hypothetical protein [Chitinispirillales bacterium]
MKTTKSATLILFALALALALPSIANAQPRPPGQATRYLPQVFIDTTVMRAFYILNETAGRHAINSNHQRHAVDRAKAVIEDLKRLARGDPNEQYALMKISEVEYQIHLEEEEMRRIAAERNIIAANQLVAQYNAEVGKMRPDFAMLRGIFRRMAEVDTRQANNLANSYNRRHRQVSREVTNSLERALNGNDFFTAKRELEYAEKNKNYLMISSTYLAAQRERLEKIENAGTEYQRIVSLLDAGEAAFNEFRLSESRTSVTMAGNRIDGIRAQIPARDASAAAARVTRLTRLLDTREDSLVKAAFTILEQQGPEAAMHYLQEDLQKNMNLSHERATIIDQAITHLMPQREITPGARVEMVDASAPPGGESLTNVRDQARLRAQRRADSIQVRREKAENISANIYALIEHKQARDAARLFSSERAFLVSTLDRSDFDRLQLSVNNSVAMETANTSRVSKHRLRAEQNMERIYAMLGRNDVRGAHKLFQKNKNKLGRHLDGEAFQMLEITVTQSFSQLSRR